jgi:hypothetical protein
MYNNTISGTATCNYIIITSFFICCARDSIILHGVLYCNYIIITSFFRCCARDSIIVHVVYYMYNNTISGTGTEKGGNDNINTV